MTGSHRLPRRRPQASVNACDLAFATTITIRVSTIIVCLNRATERNEHQRSQSNTAKQSVHLKIPSPKQQARSDETLDLTQCLPHPFTNATLLH